MKKTLFVIWLIVSTLGQVCVTLDIYNKIDSTRGGTMRMVSYLASAIQDLNDRFEFVESTLDQHLKNKGEN